jgi:hypothetical protein
MVSIHGQEPPDVGALELKYARRAVGLSAVDRRRHQSTKDPTQHVEEVHSDVCSNTASLV